LSYSDIYFWLCSADYVLYSLYCFIAKVQFIILFSALECTKNYTQRSLVQNGCAILVYLSVVERLIARLSCYSHSYTFVLE